ncbi:MAG TPA: HemK family protein methyltransferase [Tepiditoga sp.]|nr:HemK family protein methyltransferase [Tepiditoga sp.]
MNIDIRKFIGDRNIPYFDFIKFLSAVTKKDISFFIINNLTDIDEKILFHAEEHFFKNKPLEYITKEVNFLGNNFYVDERVLIPRTETEDLVKIAYKIIKKNNIKNIIDLGTGSGVIALSLKMMIPEINICASDISSEALEVFEINRKKFGLSVKTYNCDFIYGIENIINEVELILTNPPYVESAFVNPGLSYEPEIALYAGKDGQDFFRKFLFQKNMFKSKHIIAETTEFNIDLTDKIMKELGETEKLEDIKLIERFVYKKPIKNQDY